MLAGHVLITPLCTTHYKRSKSKLERLWANGLVLGLLNYVIGLGRASLADSHSVLCSSGLLRVHGEEEMYWVILCQVRQRGCMRKHGYRAIKLESSSVPQKVQPTIFDDRGVQLQRQEVVVEDSDRTAGVDIQENQRPLLEAQSLLTGCRPLVRRGGRRVGGREHRLHHQSSQRCQPQRGPMQYARWWLGHLLGLQSGRISARKEVWKLLRMKKTTPATFDGVSVPRVSSIWICLPV